MERHLLLARLPPGKCFRDQDRPRTLLAGTWREYLLPSFENLVPSWAKGRLVKYPNGWVEWVPPDATVDCYASVYFDAPWGRARTLGVWLRRGTA